MAADGLKDFHELLAEALMEAQGTADAFARAKEEGLPEPLLRMMSGHVKVAVCLLDLTCGAVDANLISREAMLEYMTRQHGFKADSA